MTEARISTGYVPHKWQRHIHLHQRRFSLVVFHRRGGKTVAAVNSLIDDALRSKVKMPRMGYVAPYRSQAKSIAWDYLKHYTHMIPGVRHNESELSVEFGHNGARIRLFGADNPDALRGMYFDRVVLDEVADMRPEVWGEIIRPAVADRKGWVLFIGTPKGINLFHELYTKHVDDPEWYVETFPIEKTLGDIPWLTAEEVEASRRDMSEAQYRQEWQCDWSASCDNTLITIDMVAGAFRKKLHASQYDRQPKVIGVDVARFGDDRSVIQRRQGLAAWPPRILRNVDNMHLASLVAQEIAEWEPDAVFIDAGRGEGVIDRLRQLGTDPGPVEVNFGGSPLDGQRYSNKRTEMWSLMAEWLRAGGALADCEELRASLVVPTYSFDAAGRMKLEPKEKIKERLGMSPDPADALALTFAEHVWPRGERRERLAEMGGPLFGESETPKRCKTEYALFGR